MTSPAVTIMIADADPYVRELAGRFITEAGYKTAFAADGYEALDAARKAPPAVIIADLLLPRLDGLALCRILKADPAICNKTSVIVFSVLLAEERSMAAGADAFVLKPLEKNRFLKALENAIMKGAVS
jgi:CheY-like chemotaxis protein